VGPREGVDGFENGVQGWWAFGPVEEQRLFALFDRFRVPLFEDSGGARGAGFAGEFVRRGWECGNGAGLHFA
jgi:hypothetical protein